MMSIETSAARACQPAVLVALLGLPGLGAAAPAATAQYTLQFDASWSDQTHPADFPGNPHFSGLVGGTHDAALTLWANGLLASPGIQRVAELGSKGVLIDEVEDAITNGAAEFVLSGNGIGNSPGTVAIQFSASQQFDRVSVVSMIAPSPDWMVGVSALDLFVDDAWIDEVTVTLYPYDAGTDSGVTYTSPNEATSPPQPVFRIEGFPFLNDGEVLPLGTFVFTRVVDENEDTDDDLVPDIADNCLLVANPDQRDTDGDGYGNACDADLDGDCQTDFSDLVLLKGAFFGNGPDEDFDGDGEVNFADLAIAKALFFAPPGPTDAPAACDAGR